MKNLCALCASAVNLFSHFWLQLSRTRSFVVNYLRSLVSAGKMTGGESLGKFFL
jgi:hypothetical protein